MALSDALDKTKQLDIEHIPVVASSGDDSFVGILNFRSVRRSLSAEVLSRQQKADNIHRAPVLQKRGKTEPHSIQHA